DTYLSIQEALTHAGVETGTNPEITWIDSELIEKNPELLKTVNCFITPGGFGERGIEGKIRAIQYARENKIPYLGLCYGMQLMVIEYARNVVGLKEANTTEINPDSKYLVVDLMPEQKEKIKNSQYGATMRLGEYPCEIKDGTLAHQAYNKNSIDERHRHRYEVNPEYIKQIEKAGLVFSGQSPDGKLMEIAELPVEKHPFMLGSQFHPEFTSSPLNPNPLFHSLIKVAIENKK
ncbi:MAG: gamma-glutamyl-gamma-aminobutyrate hydrolase family protein, partial [Candidatus Moranbacteria bacterium]|nr:gamma-glutamyl-gamma-aminobutyrate hydrolase family protein [Candidatus Moranbacteria bacterium]